MNRQNKIPDLSCYRLLLTDFLRESHPELANDDRFITARAEAAAETCMQARLTGSNDLEADEEAHLVLFQGLPCTIRRSFFDNIASKKNGRIFFATNAMLSFFHIPEPFKRQSDGRGCVIL